MKVPPRPLRQFCLDIPGWRPVLSNELLGGHHMKAAALKKRDVEQVARAKLVYGVPDATGKRRIRITIRRCKGRIPDPDSPLKSLMDALKQTRLIVDDSARWCECAMPEFVTGPKGTVIEIEDCDYET